jgi:hypothetical protein
VTRLHTADPAVVAYTHLIGRLEQLILGRVPGPLRRMVSGLTPQERHDLAITLAEAARLAHRQEHR